MDSLADDPNFPAGYAADLLRHAASTRGVRMGREVALVQLSAVQQALSGVIPPGLLEAKLAFLYLSNAEAVERDLKTYDGVEDLEDADDPV